LQKRIGSGSFGLKVTIDETLIPMFDPGTDNQSATDWVRKIDDLVSFYDWDERIVAKMATNRLREMQGNGTILFQIRVLNGAK
jgi:hypothetical protein